MQMALGAYSTCFAGSNTAARCTAPRPPPLLVRVVAPPPPAVVAVVAVVVVVVVVVEDESGVGVLEC